MPELQTELPPELSPELSPEFQAENSVLIGAGSTPQSLKLKYANRHGLIAGATGTGKTVTLQCLAEGFSNAGVPVFMADVKGDLAGLSQRGKPHPKLEERAARTGPRGFTYAGFPVLFWDVFGQDGHPVRTTVSEMGPLLLSRILRLSQAQEGVLNIAFTIADDQGLALLDYKDLRAILGFLNEHRKKISATYGNVSTASVGAIQSRLLTLERQGGAHFFGEPALKTADLMRRTPQGKGFISILAAEKLTRSPRLYATFLLWLLSELFEELPEQGDCDRPRLVFFFDEAHLLFDEAPKVLLEKVEQVVRLIRSKGVGVYFVTQNPADVPDDILGQLGNRVQHALRAFTPRDQKGVRAAAETFRANPDFKTADAITQLGVGEALVSTLEGEGVPSIVERTLIRPPSSRMGTVSAMERGACVKASPLYGVYEELNDRESAYEKLAERAAKTEIPENLAARNDARTLRYNRGFGNRDFGNGDLGQSAPRSRSKRVNSDMRVEEPERRGRMRGRGRVRNNGGPVAGLLYSVLSGAGLGRRRTRRSNRQSAGEAFTGSVLRSVGSQLGRQLGSQLGRQLARGVLGGLMRRR